VLPSRVALSQVYKSGNRLGNWSGDEGGALVIRWKNGVWTLHKLKQGESLDNFFASFTMRQEFP